MTTAMTKTTTKTTNPATTAAPPRRSRGRRPRGVVLATAAGLMLALTACAQVKPWQREELTHPCMLGDSRPEEDAAQQHMIGARESSRGGENATGGGCGCN